MNIINSVGIYINNVGIYIDIDVVYIDTDAIYRLHKDILEIVGVSDGVYMLTYAVLFPLQAGFTPVRFG